jgi:hypothetical protein
MTRFTLPDWVPLMREAFFQARDCVGSREVAAHDLYQDLIDGRLTSAIREFDSHDVDVSARTLEPGYWSQFVLRPALPDNGKPDPGMRLWLRDADLFPFWSAMFYVQRARLDQFYPVDRAAAKDTGGSPPKLPRRAEAEIRRRIGRRERKIAPAMAKKYPDVMTIGSWHRHVARIRRDI